MGYGIGRAAVHLNKNNQLFDLISAGRIIETDEPAACKIGVRPGAGCIGYLRRGHLFMKEASPPEGSVPDLGAASQVYTGMGFLELESVGALETLAPGESASLRERWSAIEVESLAGAIDLVRPS